MATGRGTVNKVILLGRLGQDPELRYTPGGAAVTTCSLATNEVWKDQDGNKKEKTDWHRVVLWRKQAELAGEYLKKGSKVYVEGKLQTRSWDDKDGNKRYMTEVVAERLEFLDSRSDGESAGAGAGAGTGTSSAPTSTMNEPAEPPAMESEDDLPF